MTKSFSISKKVVWEAYKRVKANKGAEGADKQTLQDFEENLKDNLYKIWNRMSSGSYFPPPVKRVEKPKPGGEMRPLGIPTVADRVAQMVAKLYLEPEVEPYFHRDSYGYRPQKSALDAVGIARERCWKYGWVIDLDIKGFFENIDHQLMMRAVAKHTDCKWVILYVERWLKADVELPDGTLEKRTKGTPQGGVISPLLANIFLHYAFDKWMERKYPSTPFERYADDMIVHCKTEEEAKIIRKAIEERMKECRLELHPKKTKIVYCKDSNRRGNYPEEKFDFLGYTFRPRRVKNKAGRMFVGFTPAISNQARKSIGDKIRSWKLHKRSGSSLEAIAREINPVVRGWMNYYGKYHKSALYSVWYHLMYKLISWARRKYKRLRGYRKADRWLRLIARRDGNLFAHWQWYRYT